MPDYNFSGVDDYAATLTPGGGSIPPRTSTPGGLSQDLSEMLANLGPAYTANVAQPVAKGLATGMQMLPFSTDPASQAAITSIANYLVPQTLPDLGRMAGMLASGGSGWAGSILKPAIGGVAGSLLQNDPLGLAGVEGAKGAIEGTVGKTVGAILGAAKRGGHLPGYPGQQALDEARIGQAVGEISPALGGMRTAADMQDRMLGRTGDEILSGEYQQVRDQIERGVQGQPGVGPAQSGFPAPLSGNQIAARPGGALEQITGKSSMTFDEAARAIEDLAAGRHPLTGKLTGSQSGAAERALKSQAAAELTQALNYYDPVLGVLYTDAERGAYGAGSALIRLFREKGVIDPAIAGLNVPKLQALISTNQAELEKMLGEGGWQTLRRAVLRNATPPAMDLPGVRIPFLERAYGGGMSAGLSEPITLPTSYIGEAASVPALPFTLGAGYVGNLLYPSPRNPYQRR